MKGWKQTDFVSGVQNVLLTNGQEFILPQFSCLFLLCRMVYNQMSTLFVLQGSVMDRNINIFGRNFKMAAATMTTFDTLIIIVLIPIYDRVLVPLVNLCGRRITPLQRMGWGYLVAVLSMVIASGIEFKRLQMYRDGAIVEGEINHGSQVVSISIMWQAFSYTFIGISEVFASIAGLEFFYDEVWWRVYLKKA